MTTKATSVCDGVHLFAISATCLLYPRHVRFTQKKQSNNHVEEASIFNVENTQFLERTLHARIFAAIPGVTKIGPVIEGHVVLLMGTHGLGIAVPSRRDLLTTSWVLISRGKNRILDEVRTPNVSFIVPSAELLLERTCSNDTEPCDITDTRSRELDGNPTRVRRHSSNLVTLTARPVCFTRETIPALEGKWRILPACPKKA